MALAEALIQTRDYARARQLLQESAGPAEKAGMRLLLARNYYLQATASRLGGNSGEAWSEYRQAMTLLNAVRSEPGAETFYGAAILRRSSMIATAGSASAHPARSSGLMIGSTNSYSNTNSSGHGEISSGRSCFVWLVTSPRVQSRCK